MEYKHRRAIAKTEIRKRHYKSLEEFVSHLESAIYTHKKNTFKLLKHMSIDTKESANINPGPSKEIFLHYYKELLMNKLSSRQLFEYRKIWQRN
jgi:uncharacterized cupredoxin-like copper-binding protein